MRGFFLGSRGTSTSNLITLSPGRPDSSFLVLLDGDAASFGVRGGEWVTLDDPGAAACSAD